MTHVDPETSRQSCIRQRRPDACSPNASRIGDQQAVDMGVGDPDAIGHQRGEYRSVVASCRQLEPSEPRRVDYEEEGNCSPPLNAPSTTCEFDARIVGNSG